MYINKLHTSAIQHSLGLSGQNKGAKQGYIHIQISSITLTRIANTINITHTVINTIKAWANKLIIVD